MSGTRDKKSNISLLLIACGARNFFVNLLTPHANMRYRIGIWNRRMVANVKQMMANHDRKGTLKLAVLFFRNKMKIKIELIYLLQKKCFILFNAFNKWCHLSENVHHCGRYLLNRLKFFLQSLLFFRRFVMIINVFKFIIVDESNLIGCLNIIVILL